MAQFAITCLIVVILVVAVRFGTEQGRPRAVPKTPKDLATLAAGTRDDGFTEAILRTDFGPVRWHRLGTLQIEDGVVWWRSRWGINRVTLDDASLIAVRPETRLQQLRWGPTRHVLHLRTERGGVALLVREEDMNFVLPHLPSRELANPL